MGKTKKYADGGSTSSWDKESLGQKALDTIFDPKKEKYMDKDDQEKDDRQRESEVQSDVRNDPSGMKKGGKVKKKGKIAKVEGEKARMRLDRKMGKKK